MLTQDNAASQLHKASAGSSGGLYNSQRACQEGGGEGSEEEVDYVGKPVTKKQHILLGSLSRGYPELSQMSRYLRNEGLYSTKACEPHMNWSVLVPDKALYLVARCPKPQQI